ncbi:MAG: hypothetical protein ACTSSK_15465, partial [Candidatus Heimdallarchaeota archaeon]
FEQYLLISIIVWSVLSIPLLVIGIRNFVLLLKEKDYSQRYNSESNDIEDTKIESEESLS